MMKIEIHRHRYAPFAMHCMREEYDAFPSVDALLVDAVPETLSPDRLAIAAFLAFGRWASGDFILPEKLSPAAAEAIEMAAHPVRVRPQPVEYYPKAIPLGSTTAPLSFAPEYWPGGASLCVLPADFFNGAIITSRGIAVASNAFLLDAAEPSTSSIRARLAVAVLFAEDFDIAALRIPAAHAPDSAELVELKGLLSACGLGLELE
ncbi:hypothetical protein [Schaalia hyovaginalis]|uniref:hypothetical protein n=1 Tax=Schaalia hyovaginalis TaxID=29316 RepID=UPI002A8169AC|nr:hypothetical protein [Schaalia hyovaginalis]MDY3664634.1 hypothetical protein [Schaalia hyovaginalis]